MSPERKHCLSQRLLVFLSQMTSETKEQNKVELGEFLSMFTNENARKHFEDAREKFLIRV